MFKVPKWEGGFVVCERIGKAGEKRQPVKVKTPPQKRRAVIRVGSAETEECVSGQQGLEELGAGEVEELSSVPSAVSEPQWALHISDNKCREEGFKFFQLSAIVTEEGGPGSHNKFAQCYNDRQQRQGEQPVKAARWRETKKQKACRGKLWVAFGMEQYARRNAGKVRDLGKLQGRMSKTVYGQGNMK